eukprot:2906491-Lingulodinium_polyedra.AAC.1
MFYAILAIASAAAQLREDIYVRVLCENAGSTLDMFRMDMGRTLGMDAGETRNHILESSAKEWTALPREMILLSTL